MTKRSRLNMLLAAVIASAAPLTLAPSPASAGLAEEGDAKDGDAAEVPNGGTCCPAASGICYLNLGGGVIVKVTPAFYQEPGKACP